MELVAAYARTERSTENESAPTLATPARNFRTHAVGEPGSVVLFLFRMPTYYISLAISRSSACYRIASEITRASQENHQKSA